MRGTATALGLATGAALAGLAWATLETRMFTLREVTVPVLPAGQRNLRVLHVSDIHLVPSQASKIAWVRDLAALRPDLVVDTGDNMAHLDALAPLLGALEPLLALPGAFVMGSNDYFAPSFKNPVRYLLPDSRGTGRDVVPVPLPADELGATMRAAGWKDLTNRRDVVVADGRRISLVGVDDAHLDRDVFPDVEASTGGPAVDLRLGSPTPRTDGCSTRCTQTVQSSRSPGTRTEASSACRSSVPS